jgi:hypothetical protein
MNPRQASGAERKAYCRPIALRAMPRRSASIIWLAAAQANSTAPKAIARGDRQAQAQHWRRSAAAPHRGHHHDHGASGERWATGWPDGAGDMRVMPAGRDHHDQDNRHHRQAGHGDLGEP